MKKVVQSIALVSVLLILYAVQKYNFLLFHLLVELFSIIVGILIFVIIFNFHENTDSQFLKNIGITLLPITVIDFIHTLSYKGMNLMQGYDANLPTQLWILARYLQALFFLFSVYYNKQSVNANSLLFISNLLAILGLILIFTGYFPDSYIEGVGLTSFKKISEYIISGILLIATIYLYNTSNESIKVMRSKIIWIFILTILSEISFTFYSDVTGTMNYVGHNLKLLAWLLLYKVVVQRILKHPLDMLYYDLVQTNKRLEEKQSRVNALEGLFSICSYCNSIKSTDGTWEKLDLYVSKHSDLNFSHGVCEKCYTKLVDE
ncbi:MAG: hypothetical protein INQ03_13870 [Candidatus Heimdallarchaeota archaeon]|nr:hypothetical protein [Candidatus Heimdallarchaeota archaeon]